MILDDYDLKNLLDYIDWTPFFISWGLVGKYPKIFSDDVVGEQAQVLFDDAQNLLKQLIDNKQLTAKACADLPLPLARVRTA